MAELDHLLLAAVVAFTAGVYGACTIFLRSSGERYFLAASLAGLCLFSGVGAAWRPALWEYAGYFACFVTVFAAAYLSALSTARAAAVSEPAVYSRLEALARSPAVRSFAVPVYLTLCAAPLVYPELRIGRLWNPPPPDLMAALNRGVHVDPPLALRLAAYAQFAIWPLYLLRLYAFRRRPIVLPALAILPLYARYCATGYIGRGDMLASLAMVVSVVWLDRPRLRLPIASAVLIAIPLLLVFFGQYSRLRMGGAAVLPAAEQVEALLRVETSLPRSWDRMVSSGGSADLGSYFLWLLTLPVPKVLTGPIAGVRINEEINAIVSSASPGDLDYSIVLTGPVIESRYIYGPSWFWIHAIFMGCAAGALAAFAGGSSSLLVILIHMALLFGYNFSRGGIGAAAPALFNTYLTLYGAVFWFWITTVPRRTATCS